VSNYFQRGFKFNRFLLVRDLLGMTTTVTILGSGTAIPIRGRAPAAVLWQGSEKTILLDIGPGTLLRLEEQGVNYQTLSDIFLTHLHSDHTLDLVTLLQANDCIPSPGRQVPLSLTGCKGTQSFFAQLMDVFPGIAPAKYPFRIIEKTAESWRDGQLQVRTALTGHTPFSLAYRVESPDGIFVYTGDAVLTDSLINLCQNADLLICDCSYPAGVQSPDHMNAIAVGQLAASANVKCLIPTHFYPQALDSNITAEIKRHYSGPILPATDGMKLRIPTGESA
jgi:ribonuclease BN (tRNA processing enzyme)